MVTNVFVDKWEKNKIKASIYPTGEFKKRYKCIGIELDLFPQLTTKNSLYVYYCKHGNRQIESPLPFQSSTQCT